MRYPASPPPLSNQDTYTTWPGGVDPTARVYDSVGGASKRKARMAAKSPKSGLKRRKTPRRRSTRKGSRKAKANRKVRTRRY
jgi:hypothetical protein